jgi:hypothetical protein
VIDDVLRDLVSRRLRLGGRSIGDDGIEVTAQIDTRHNTVARCRHRGKEGDDFALKIFNTNKAIWSDGAGMEVLALRLLSAVGLPVPTLEYVDVSLRVIDRPFLVTRWHEGVAAVPADLVVHGGFIAKAVGRLCARMAGVAEVPNPASFLCSSGSVHGAAMNYLRTRALPLFRERKQKGVEAIIEVLEQKWEVIPAPTRFALVVHDLKCEHILLGQSHDIVGIIDFDSYFADDPVASIAEFLAVIHTQLDKTSFESVSNATLSGWGEVGGAICLPRVLFRMVLKNLHDAADACSAPHATPGIVATRVASAAALTRKLSKSLAEG